MEVINHLTAQLEQQNNQIDQLTSDIREREKVITKERKEAEWNLQNEIIGNPTHDATIKPYSTKIGVDSKRKAD